MRRAYLILGALFFFYGLFKGGRYLTDYGELTEYGKGIFWGSVILIIVGLLLIYFGYKKPKSTPEE